MEHKDEFKGQIEPLRSFLEEYVDHKQEPEKLRQYFETKRVINYYEGRQNLAYERVGDYIDLVPYSGVQRTSAEQDEDDEVYDFKINIVRGDGRKYRALLGARAPNPKAVPDNPKDETQVARARKMDLAARLLYSWWEIKEVHRDLLLGQWIAGTQFLHTPYVEDEFEYGSHSTINWTEAPEEVMPAGYECGNCGGRVPELPPDGACPGCGAPMAGQDYREPVIMSVPKAEEGDPEPNGRVELYVYNSLNVTVPFHSPKKVSKFPWLVLDLDVFAGDVIEKFPEVRDDVLSKSGSGADTEAGRGIRQSLKTPSGTYDDTQDIVTCRLYWLRPAMFHLIREDNLREKLRDLCPNGARIIRIFDKIVSIFAERLDHVWAIVQPESARTVFTQPLAADHVDIQDVLNLLTCIGVETLERGVAWMLADPSVVDFDQLSARVRHPAEVVPIRSGMGSGLREAVKEAPDSSFSDQLMPFSTSILDQARENVGILRAAWGGEPLGGNQTAKEYVGRRNQALTQLSDPWDCLRLGLAQALKNAIRQLILFGQGNYTVPGEAQGQNALSLEEGDEEGWKFEMEESIPVSPGERSDRVRFLLERPDLADLLKITSPDNLSKLQDMLGLPELRNIDVEAVEAIREILNQLAQEQPISEQDPATGESIDRPSIPPKWEEEPELAVAVAKAYLITEGARIPETGYNNVIAWGRAQEERISPPPEEEGGGTGSPPAPTDEAIPPQPEVPISR